MLGRCPASPETQCRIIRELLFHFRFEALCHLFKIFAVTGCDVSSDRVSVTPEPEPRDTGARVMVNGKIGYRSYQILALIINTSITTETALLKLHTSRF